MNAQQKELVDLINSTEEQVKNLSKEVTKSIEETNETKIKIYNLREELRELYLKLKEETDKVKKDSIDS
jgi:hypothetical protein